MKPRVRKNTRPESNEIGSAQKLTRQESKLLTRRRLIEAGRKEILSVGFAKAAAERIAGEVGYSRGAFYGNFADMEDLFMAVMLQDHERQYNVFQTIADHPTSPETVLRELRDALAERVTDAEWLSLHAEFEAGALHSEKMRSLYVELHRRILGQGKDVLGRLAKEPNIRMRLRPLDFILTMVSLIQGLAINQRLLGTDLSKTSTRRLVRSIFDKLIWIEG